MAFIPLPNTIKAELVFDWDGQRCENVYHVLAAGEINEAELDALHGNLYTWYSTVLSTIQPESVSFVKFILSDVSDQYGISKEYAPGLVYQGAITASPSLPNNVSIAVKWNTGFRGRSYRGRTFHVGLWESVVTGNNIISESLPGFVSGYNSLLGILDAAGRTLVVASRFQGNAPRVTGVTTPILTVTCDGVIDSQRRRLPGRGA